MCAGIAAAGTAGGKRALAARGREQQRQQQQQQQQEVDDQPAVPRGVTAETINLIEEAPMPRLTVNGQALQPDQWQSVTCIGGSCV